ncbi:MAG: SDR family oxidoreductase [Pseudonocardiaceae bacterium]|nr:SDR family oxidoreductase [Pseudonocardiaceae bacterium]
MTGDALFDVRGSRVVVTGAGSGLGLAIATCLAERGAIVTMAEVNRERLEATCEELAGRGLDVTAVPTDVREPDQVDELIERVTTAGDLDVVFANAGISAGPGFSRAEGEIDALKPSDWDAVRAVNLDGVVATLRAAAHHMKRQRSGKIVVTASTAGLRTDPMVGYAYVATKAAVVNLMKQAALELAPYGVTVNAIAPGPFRTNIGGDGGPSPDVEARWAETVPLGRMANPRELYGLALLLASPASSFMTGAVYPVDGGALARSHTA